MDGQAGNDDPWDFRNFYPILKYGGIDLRDQVHLRISVHGEDDNAPMVGEPMQTSFGIRHLLVTRGLSGVVWEVSDDGVTGWTPVVSRDLDIGRDRIGARAQWLILPTPAEANKRFRVRMLSRERGWIYSYPTPPVKTWTGATATLSFASGHNPPRERQQITVSGDSSGLNWVRCNDTTGSRCAVASSTPWIGDQGKYLYAYRYYTDSNGVRTKASTPFIGPIQAAASSSP